MRDLTLNRLPVRLQSELDLETIFKASRCVIAAERLLVFRKLHGKALSAEAVSRNTGIHRRYCQSFLDYLVYLGLLKKSKKLYSNTALANRHFVKARSIGWTRMWSLECAKDFEAMSVLEDAMLSGQDWRILTGTDRKPDYQLAREDAEWAEAFTLALYDLHRPDAEALASKLDLSEYQSLLDVGGGSGVMSLALARSFPHLRASVFDFEFVCAATRKIIRKERMSRRIKTIAGDMNEAIPSGFDVIMFWDIGRIDTRVIKMAYDSLPVGGLVVRSCRPLRKSKGPSPGRFLHEYLSVRPEGQSRIDKIRSLKFAGFTSVKYRPIGQGLGMITALKR